MNGQRAIGSRAGGVSEVIGQIKAERTRLVLFRLSFVAVLLLAGVSVAWTAPSVPIGLQARHMESSVVIALALAWLSGLAAVVFLFAWGALFRHESLPEFLRVLFGARQLIRGRGQFLNRLTTECRRARRDRRWVFSLIVIELPELKHRDDGSGWAPYEVAAMVVRSSVRAHDIVAQADAREIWVLAVGVGAEARDSIAQRLAGALSQPDVPVPAGGGHLGGSTFAWDGEDADALFYAARRRLRALAQAGFELEPGSLPVAV